MSHVQFGSQIFINLVMEEGCGEKEWTWGGGGYDKHSTCIDVFLTCLQRHGED